MAGDQGRTTVETVFIQLDTEFTPSGRFPLYRNGTLPNEKKARVGYDAAVCVEKYEPWVIEAYNTSTGSSFALRVIGKGDGSTSLPPSGNIQGARIANTRRLNATGKGPAFSTVHDNAADRLRHAGGDDSLPTPTVGPIMPPHTIFLLTLDVLRRLFLSLMALNFMDIPNSLPTGLL